MVDSGTKSDLNCGGLTQEVSEENFCMLPRNHSCDILMKNVSAFYLCLKNLSEAKVKKLRLRESQNSLT